MPNDLLSSQGLNKRKMLDELKELEAIIKSSVRREDSDTEPSVALLRMVSGTSAQEIVPFLRVHGLQDRWLCLDMNEDFSGLDKFNRHLETLIRDRDRDYLTRLHNRRFFERVISREIELSAEFRVPMTLVILDVDDFKEINDIYGHSQGDMALKIIARVLKEEIRATDTAARIGGEEFALILSGSGLSRADAIMDRIRKRVMLSPVKVDKSGKEFNVTVSIGAAAYRGVGRADREMIFNAADKALYQAKSRGKNRVETTVVLGLKPEDTAVVGRDEKKFLFADQ
ncbi:MAG: GGDEF domain-containing protein [Thermodesulfobacteriota bacterium]